MARKAVVKDQRTFKQAISQRIFIDITRNPKHVTRGKSKSLSGKFHDATQRLSVKIMESIEAEITPELKEQYIMGLDFVASVMKTGIDFGDEEAYDFPAFSKQYASRKITADKHRRGSFKTARKYWVKEAGSKNNRMGWLYPEFKKFAKGYKASIRNTKGVVKLHSSKYIYRGNRFRISIDMAMPVPQVGGEFFKRIFHDAFFDKGTSTPVSAGLANAEVPDDLRKMAWLEAGVPNRPDIAARPFIANKMRLKGGVARLHMDRMMIRLAKEAKTRGYVGFN